MSAEKGKPEAKKHNQLPKASTSNSDATTAHPPSSDGTPDWLSAPAHTLDADVCIKTFKTDPKFGLDEATVKEHQGIFGPNKLKENPPPSFWSILLRNALNGELALLGTARQARGLANRGLRVATTSGTRGFADRSAAYSYDNGSYRCYGCFLRNSR